MDNETRNWIEGFTYNTMINNYLEDYEVGSVVAAPKTATRKDSRHIQTFHGVGLTQKHGVGLTQKEIDWIVRTTTVGCARAGSTQAAVVRKIKAITGWDMPSQQIVYRFAYAFGLVRL